MSKKKWFLIILIVAVIGYLLLSKIYPAVGTAIDNLVGPTVSGFFTGVYLAIVTSPIWMAYDIYFAFAGGAILIGLILWQGHNVYNKTRQWAARSAAQEAYGVPARPAYQTIPSAQPAAIPPASTQVVQPQQVQQTQTPPPQQEPPKE